MKSAKWAGLIASWILLVITACQDSREADDYSGVSELIAERNKARYESQQKRASEKSAEQPRSVLPDRKEDLSSPALFEEKVDIVVSGGGRTLAKGTAYLNKQGQIVRIKILKE